MQFIELILIFFEWGTPYNSDIEQNQSDIKMRRSTNMADRVLSISEMIERAGDKHIYQLKMLLQFSLVFLFCSFIQMGFPIIFQPAQFICPPDQDCSEESLCQSGEYELDPSVKSVAYSFSLVCEKKKYLTTCFEAFLYGGFLGSLYYGEMIQRKGRRYAVIESLMMMGAGLALALVSGSAVLFSVGVFFFNAGFRGFYNASFLSISEVSDKVLRTSSPMVLSIGWALGQILIALLALFIINWRIIFALTLIPLGILFYFIFYHVRDSPRFCVTKHEFATAKAVVEQIAYMNQRPLKGVELRQEMEYRTRIENYQQILQGGQFSSRQVHHSYFSLFRFNSIRIRVIFVSVIWSIISLSYFISAKNQLDPSRSYTFNIALAGVIEIVAYLSSVATNINLQRLYVIKRLLIVSAVVHLCFYFVHPLDGYYTGGAKIAVLILEILIRILMSYGNTFLAIYSIELFPTSIRHFALGMLGFITKLMYMLSFIFDEFFIQRYIHPNFILGLLMLGACLFIPKLRETQDIGIKDNLSEDGDNLLMNETYASIF